MSYINFYMRGASHTDIGFLSAINPNASPQKWRCDKYYFFWHKEVILNNLYYCSPAILTQKLPHYWSISCEFQPQFCRQIHSANHSWIYTPPKHCRHSHGSASNPFEQLYKKTNQKKKRKSLCVCACAHVWARTSTFLGHTCEDSGWLRCTHGTQLRTVY